MRSKSLLSIGFVVLILSTGTLFAQDTATTEDPLSLLWEQVAAQPDDFSVGCVPLYDPASTVLYNADQAFPLASITKLLIFIEYARRLDAGEIAWSELVDVDTLERYNLPRTDRGAHDRFMAQYPSNTEQISLYELALGMMQYSSNAASDYLLDRLDPVDWDSLYRTLGITNTGYPHSLTMIPLLMNNHVTGKPAMSDVETLSAAQGETALDLYVQDEAWRQAEIDYRSGRGSQFPSWDVQTAILEQHTASGTVSDFLKVMGIIYGEDDTLPENVKSLARISMLWTDDDFIDEWYLEYGSKLGFYSGGTLTLVAYGNPYEGDPVISAIFLRAIPRAMYGDMLEQDSIGALANWLSFNTCSGLSEALARTVQR